MTEEIRALLEAAILWRQAMRKDTSKLDAATDRLYDAIETYMFKENPE